MNWMKMYIDPDTGDAFAGDPGSRETERTARRLDAAERIVWCEDTATIVQLSPPPVRRMAGVTGG